MIFELVKNIASHENGELDFLKKIINDIDVIFDVGCRKDSAFIDFKKEVHYFDPMEEFISNLQKQKNKNIIKKFNSFGLGNENISKRYNIRSQSIVRNSGGKFTNIKIKKGFDYCKDNNIKSIDFIKIDTEGYELEVLKGMGDILKNIKIIQFEYGGTYISAKITLNDVITHLKNHGFHKFAYLQPNNKIVLFEDICDMSIKMSHYVNKNTPPVKVKTNGKWNDHWCYSNIVCINKNSDITPY